MATDVERGQAAQRLVDQLRGSVETAQGKVDIGGQFVWRDYARGKDIARYLKSQPDATEGLVRPAGGERTSDDVARDAVSQMVQRKLLLACDRKFKRPKPGRTKLVKWPRTLEVLQEQDFREDAFYAWVHDRPTSAWFYFASALVVVGVLAVTLMPLAPNWVRLAVLYVLSTFLVVLVGTMLLRYVVWGAVWIATGHHLWVLPNLTSETLPVTHIFTPLVTFERTEAGESPQYAARAVTLLVLLGAGYGLARTAPDAGSVGKSVRDAHSSLLEYLDLNNAKDFLADGKANTTMGSTTAGAAGGAADATRRAREREHRRHAQQQQQAEEQEEKEEEGTDKAQGAEAGAGEGGAAGSSDGEL